MKNLSRPGAAPAADGGAPPPSPDITRLPTDTLLERRGVLAYAQQMAAAEGLAVDAATLTEIEVLAAELSRRGVG